MLVWPSVKMSLTPCPSFSDMSNRGVQFTQPWTQRSSQLQKQFAQLLFEYQSSRVHTHGSHLWAGNWKVDNYLYSFFL